MFAGKVKVFSRWPRNTDEVDQVSVWRPEEIRPPDVIPKCAPDVVSGAAEPQVRAERGYPGTHGA